MAVGNLLVRRAFQAVIDGFAEAFHGDGGDGDFVVALIERAQLDLLGQRQQRRARFRLRE